MRWRVIVMGGGAACVLCFAAIGATDADQANGHIRATYDHFYAQIYDELWSNDGVYKWAVKNIRRYIDGPAAGIKILEAGCGTGTTYALLAKHYPVVGLDISPAMIDEARKKNPGGNFIVGDMKDTTLFADGFFTHITSLGQAPFYNKEYPVIFENFHKWLQDGGYLIFDAMDRENMYENIGPVETEYYYVKRGRNVAYNLAAYSTYPGFGLHTWWKLPSGDDRAVYYEDIVFDAGPKKRIVHTMYLPTLDKLEEVVESAGFQLVERLHVFNDTSSYLYVFQK